MVCCRCVFLLVLSIFLVVLCAPVVFVFSVSLPVGFGWLFGCVFVCALCFLGVCVFFLLYVWCFVIFVLWCPGHFVVLCVVVFLWCVFCLVLPLCFGCVCFVLLSLVFYPFSCFAVFFLWCFFLFPLGFVLLVVWFIFVFVVFLCVVILLDGVWMHYGFRYLYHPGLVFVWVFLSCVPLYTLCCVFGLGCWLF